MEWTDEGLVLSSRRHGEAHSIVTVFTREHGAVAAMVHGGQGRRRGPIVQPGNTVSMVWRAKAPDALGHATLELVDAHAGTAMMSTDRREISALSALTDLLDACLRERDVYTALYDATKALLSLIAEQDYWPILLSRWEVGLLDALGFGLTLDRCVATDRLLADGAELAFVSPKSGGAVSFAAGEPYRDKMFALPGYLIDQGEPTVEAVRAGLLLTGHFLEERVLAPANQQLPASREQYIRRALQAR